MMYPGDLNECINIIENSNINFSAELGRELRQYLSYYRAVEKRAAAVLKEHPDLDTPAVKALDDIIWLGKRKRGFLVRNWDKPDTWWKPL